MVDSSGGDISFAYSHFPPTEDYAFLSDCDTTALVAPDGGVEWLRLPGMDSPSVFGSVLDRDAGRFRVNPSGVYVPAGRRYIPGTLVKRIWWAPGGWLVVTDALLMGPWHHDSEQSATHHRAPTDYEAAHVLLRLIRCVNGQVQVDMECIPMFDYGRAPARWAYVGDGYHEAVAHAEGSTLQLRLTTDLNVGFEATAATARTLLKEGDSRFVALSWNDQAPPRTLEEASDLLGWTCHHWQHWLDRATFPDHRWRGHLQRSAPTLKGPLLRLDGCCDGGRDHLAAQNPWRCAQLGLPLHLDPRHRWNIVGVEDFGAGLGGERLFSTSSPTLRTRPAAICS